MKTRMILAVLIAVFLFAIPAVACSGNGCGDGGNGGNATATATGGSVNFHPEFDLSNINNVSNTNNNNANNENRNTNTNTNHNTNTNLNNNTNINSNRADANAAVVNSGNSHSSSNSAVIGSGNSASCSSAKGGEANSTNTNTQANEQKITVEGDTLNQTFEAPEIPRNFANGVEMNYAPTPTYTGPDMVNSNVVDLENLLDYKSVFTRAELRKMSKKADANVRDNTTAEKASKEDRKRQDRSIPVFLGAPTARIESLGMMTVVADDFETTTIEVMAIAALGGLDINADAMYVMAYGGDKMVESSGWGLGLNSSAATINGNSDLSTVNSGGTGYSSGKAGLKTKPWVHVHMVRFAPEMP